MLGIRKRMEGNRGKEGTGSNIVITSKQHRIHMAK